MSFLHPEMPLEVHMSLPFLSRRFFRKWLSSNRIPHPFVKKRQSVRPFLEQLEDRTLMSVLPPALVSNPTAIATGKIGGFSPDVAQDPVNPRNLVEVHVNSAGTLLVANYSTDGGQTWTGFINTSGPNTLANIKDPTTNAAFTVVTNPTVTIDRAENVYITDIERNAKIGRAHV